VTHVTHIKRDLDRWDWPELVFEDFAPLDWADFAALTFDDFEPLDAEDFAVLPPLDDGAGPGFRLGDSRPLRGLALAWLWPESGTG